MMNKKRLIFFTIVFFVLMLSTFLIYKMRSRIVIIKADSISFYKHQKIYSNQTGLKVTTFDDKLDIKNLERLLSNRYKTNEDWVNFINASNTEHSFDVLDTDKGDLLFTINIYEDPLSLKYCFRGHDNNDQTIYEVKDIKKIQLLLKQLKINE